jgi:4-aminobutyrate aminotransferase
VARKSVMTWQAGSHGNTYGGNPLACAAALATLDVLEEEGIENAAVQGTYIMEALRAMAERHACIGDVRGRGLMIGVEFVEDRESRTPAIALRNRIVQLAFEHGLLLMGCGVNTMRIIPPLTITRAEVDEGLAIFEHVITLAEEEV